MMSENFAKLKEAIITERKALGEIDSSFQHLKTARDNESKKMAREHIRKLKDSMKKANDEILKEIDAMNIAKPLTVKKEENSVGEKKNKMEEMKEKIFMESRVKFGPEDRKLVKELSSLEKETIKRLKKGKETVTTKESEKPKGFTKLANKFFYNMSAKISGDKTFETMRKDLIKTDLNFTPTSYVSIIFFSATIAAIIGFAVFLFFLFFKIGFNPIISMATESFSIRFIRIFWILFLAPIATFLFMFFYPSLERKSIETKINRELPFAAIHMSAISQSLIEPSKIFSIIIATKDYPSVGKEFTKLINKINIYGYDLVTSLRNTALNTSSKKLSDLLNGLATTITSGGDLREFFEKRAQTLLFDHRLEREKETKAAETFMDIYISVVIAAPMVLMLLLMMMRISGLGISLSTSAITLIMVMGVSILNIAFLSFLHLKKSAS